jgi:predicted AlkP superfamily pyrophosphatase or phosphodiesterase
MNRTVVLNVVGLTPRLVGKHTPFLSRWIGNGKQAGITPVLPAVTTSMQATYLTGTMPREHGIVGNGWYFRAPGEIHFWMRSDRLVKRPKVWEVAREQEASFTCANLFWRYATHSSADYIVVERPMYPADGRKIPDLYTRPAGLRFDLQEKLGQFPLFKFWGPDTSITGSEWIANAAKLVEARHAPTLTLLYLPHLDYNLQRLNPDTESATIATDLRAVDTVCRDLITFYEGRGVQVILLSEYGLTAVSRPIALNRVFRRNGLISVREELGRELLEPGDCAAFAVADHQIAHVYVNDWARRDEVGRLLEATPGVAKVLGVEGKREYGLDHPRAGAFVAVAEPDAWFTYYYWLDDAKAPDFAPTVEIHRKPGYDPAELFMDPDLRSPRLRAAGRLLQKKLGFRYLMDVVPIHGDLVQGSHGRLPGDARKGPLLATQQTDRLRADRLHATDVRDVILEHVFGADRARSSAG